MSQTKGSLTFVAIMAQGPLVHPELATQPCVDCLREQSCLATINKTTIALDKEIDLLLKAQADKTNSIQSAPSTAVAHQEDRDPL